jgi:hypothetical protein
MAKLDCCNHCEFYAHSPYMVCAVHPGGVEGNHCQDFRLAPSAAKMPDAPLAWYGDEWQPERASYYGEELILEPVQWLSLEQRLEVLDSHPLFTGRCPNCEMPIQATAGQVHWDCGHCGWLDDSV